MGAHCAHCAHCQTNSLPGVEQRWWCRIFIIVSQKGKIVWLNTLNNFHIGIKQCTRLSFRLSAFYCGIIREGVQDLFMKSERERRRKMTTLWNECLGNCLVVKNCRKIKKADKKRRMWRYGRSWPAVATDLSWRLHHRWPVDHALSGNLTEFCFIPPQR